MANLFVAANSVKETAGHMQIVSLVNTPPKANQT